LNNKGPRAPEVSGPFLIRLFIEEYWLVLLTIISLMILSTYVLFYLPERLLDILVFVLLWLQLELSYKQWWLEFNQRRPILRLTYVETSVVTENLRFYVENIGSETAREVYVEPVAVSKKAYKKYYRILLSKGYMFKKIGFVGCGEGFGRGVRLLPHETDFVEVDLSQLTRCIKSESEVLFFLICYDEPMELGISVCTEAVNLEVSEGYALVYSVKLDNELPPGTLVKLPYMLRDARMYWLMYKADRRREPRSESNKEI
jgi:hypothetical protein